MSKAKIALANCIGLFCTDLNTRKIMGLSKESLAKKMLLLKSKTKLEDLTVPIKSFGNLWVKDSIHK